MTMQIISAGKVTFIDLAPRDICIFIKQHGFQIFITTYLHNYQW